MISIAFKREPMKLKFKKGIFNKNDIVRDSKSRLIFLKNPFDGKTHTNKFWFSAIQDKDSKRVVTVYSALAPGYTDAVAFSCKMDSK